MAKTVTWTPALQEILFKLGWIRLMACPTVGDALEYQARFMLEDSKLQVPLDEGPLQDTGRINKRQYNSGESKVSISIAYGGLSKTYGKWVKYAVKQHENMNFKHKEGRKAKYLEDPVQQHWPMAVKNCKVWFDALVGKTFNIPGSVFRPREDMSSNNKLFSDALNGG